MAKRLPKEEMLRASALLRPAWPTKPRAFCFPPAWDRAIGADPGSVPLSLPVGKSCQRHQPSPAPACKAEASGRAREGWTRVQQSALGTTALGRTQLAPSA